MSSSNAIHLQRPRVTYQVECRPKVWMHAIRTDGCTCASQECTLRTGQSSSLAKFAAQQRLIKHFHQFRAAGIIYLPQRWQKRSRPCIEETPSQANHFIHSANDGASGFTGA